ncbi:MAG: SCO family protein [Proteobacteria bacterium]|nr:SCO family protein [Pseudomonadota bacterium]
MTTTHDTPRRGNHQAGTTTILGRRRLGAGAAALVLAGLGAKPARAAGWHNVDVRGSVPALAFTMTDATTGKPVTAADFRGKVVLLYFGYTNCPDVCPLTLHNIALILQRLGPAADAVRVLFVTVDPHRDTLAVLRAYTALFAPQIVGLRPSANQLARLARRYRLAYSASPATASHPYEVTHSAAVYAFDRTGAARLLIPSLASTTPDLGGTTEDLRRLLDGGGGKRGWLGRLVRRF